jgi:hypothetical protein
MGPIHGMSNTSMFDWIVVNVFHMPRQIGFIPNLMLPISSLPKASLAFCRPAPTDAFALFHPTRESGLDQGPSQRIINVPLRQTPDNVKMFRQDHHCQD